MWEQGTNTIISSSDGMAWKEEPSANYRSLKGITYGNGLFVIVGGLEDIYQGTTVILTSRNGTLWELQGGYGWPLASVCYANNLFVAVGFGINYRGYVGGGSLVSSNGTAPISSWASTFGKAFQSVVFGNGKFVAVGSSGMIGSSSDGLNWTERVSGTTNWLRGVAYGAGAFVAVGDGGTILQSDLTIPRLLIRKGPIAPSMELIIFGELNGPYRLQYSTQLASPNWLDLGALTNQQAPIRINEKSDPDLPQKFYRAIKTE